MMTIEVEIHQIDANKLCGIDVEYSGITFTPNRHHCYATWYQGFISYARTEQEARAMLRTATKGIMG